MSTSRRDFLRSTASLSMLTLGSRAFGALQQSPTPAPTTRPAGGGNGKMTILILGGTGFLGPHVVEAAQAHGHTLTLFNRGKTRPQLFPELEKLRGDRDGDLKALEGRKWDAVVDTSGYIPRVVKASAELLKDNVKHYTFISTLNVYADTSKPSTDEDAPYAKVPGGDEEHLTNESYGPLKARCEQTAEETLPGRVANIRPGLIVGPGDPSDRYTYWPVRVAQGGEVLAPGAAEDPVQYIDVRDLGEWVVLCIEKNVVGAFNAVGPKDELTIGTMLNACKRASENDAKFTWVDADFLAKKEVTPWADMPVWVPPKGDEAGFARVSNKRAIAKGLKFRSPEVTAKETLAWFKAQPEDRQKRLRAGISHERELEVLKAWHDEKK